MAIGASPIVTFMVLRTHTYYNVIIYDTRARGNSLKVHAFLRIVADYR